MNTVLNFGKGKLTYTMAGLAIVYASLALWLQWGDQDTNIGILWLGLTTFGFRRAIK